MNASQHDHIRRTFALIEPIAPVAASRFYGQLFELAPATRALFRYEPGSAAMARQGARLMQTLAIAVANLNRLEQVTPALEELARRHASYGVEPAHDDVVGAALLWTLEQGLCSASTPEVAESWAMLYGTLAPTMKRAAYGPTPARAAAHGGAPWT